MPISLDSTFDKQIKRENPVENSPLILFDLATDIYCHGSDMTYDSNRVYGLLKSWTLKEGKLDFRHGKAAPNTATLTFNNEYRDINGTRQRLSDFIFNQNYLNQLVTVYWWTEANTTIAQLPIVFRGRIDARPETDDNTVRISLKDSIHTKYINIPMTLADKATFPRVPVENQNKPLPLIWGDLRNFIGHTIASALRNFIDSGLTPCFLVDPSAQKYVVAAHQVDSIPSTFSIWGYDKSIKDFVRLNSYTTSNSSSGAFFTKDGQSFTHAQLPDGQVENVAQVNGALWDATNKTTLACNLRSSDFAEATNINAADDLLRFDVKFAHGKLPDGATDSYNIGAIYKMDSNGTATRLEFGTTNGLNDVSDNTGNLAQEIFTAALGVVDSAIVNLDSDNTSITKAEIYESKEFSI